MAEENNQASVEIDTDGVNEQTINVETPQRIQLLLKKKKMLILGIQMYQIKKLLKNF